MKITWLGQSGYVFESGGQRLLVDPFLSDIVEQRQGLKRLMQPPVALSHLHPHYVFITHNHLDHFDPVAIPEMYVQYPHCIFAGPESVIKHAEQLGFEASRLRLITKGNSLQLGAFEFRATPAFHSDPFSIGCMLQVEGKRIYLSGDTLLEPALVEEVVALGGLDADLAFIVINGKLGNMNVNEAVEFMKVLKPKLAIPMHYGMFTENTEDPLLFTQGCEQHKINSAVLVPGRVFLF